MFNLIITGKCSKNCSFCFTEEDARKNDLYEHMSLEYIKEIAERYEYKKKGHVLKLLGGEPTEHPQFLEIIEYAKKEQIPIYLISNLLFGEKILKGILSNIDIFTSFLVNGAELTEKNRLPLFIKNFNKVSRKFAFSKRGSKQRFTLAQTVPKDNFEAIDYSEYLNQLKGALDFSNLGGIRIGIGLNGKYLLNNKKLGDKVAEIVRFNLANNLETQFDCQFPPCIFRKELFEELESEKFSLWNMVTQNPDAKTFPGGICNDAAYDLLPDESLLYCYQTQSLISEKLPDIEKAATKAAIDESFIGTLGAGFDHLTTHHIRAKYLQEREKFKTLDECKDCHLYPQYCGSLCLGCYSGITQPTAVTFNPTVEPETAV